MSAFGLDWLPARLDELGDREAITGPRGTATFAELADRARAWEAKLDGTGWAPGESVAVVADLAPDVVAAVVALAVRGHVVVPFVPASPPPDARRRQMGIADVTCVMELGRSGDWTMTRVERPTGEVPEPLRALRSARESGLVLFSSGSTGEVKAALHSLPKLLDRFQTPARGFRSVQFMAIDHIGGINTLFHALCNGGTAIVEVRRTPERICRVIEQHRAELLPTTPTFLNMLLISGVYEEYDLSSLELITYGTEPMREVTLAHLRKVFPGVRLKQTYGLTETGILPTRSSSPDSLSMQVGGRGFETRVVDDVLWVRSPSSMLGYLNSADPFDEEGWLDTGDVVEVADDGSIKVVARRSTCINVGGEKVYPSQVENVLLQAPNVRDAVVESKANPVTGEVVAAYVDLAEPEPRRDMVRRLRAFCSERLSPHQVPAVFAAVEGPLHGERFKRRRPSS